MTKQKGKGKKRKRGWHRGKRSAGHFDNALKRIEKVFKQAEKEHDGLD